MNSTKMDEHIIKAGKEGEEITATIHSTKKLGEKFYANLTEFLKSNLKGEKFVVLPWVKLDQENPPERGVECILLFKSGGIGFDLSDGEGFVNENMKEVDYYIVTDDLPKPQQ